MTSKPNEKLRLFALIEPLNLKMSLCFPADTLVADIHYFVDDIMRKYNVKYKVGRVDWNGAWILPQYRIGDFFEDKTDITIYSIEYGLTLTSLSSERDRLHVNHSVFYQDLNTNFLKKKLSRDQRKKGLTANVSRTTEVNDPNEIDAVHEEGLKDERIEEPIVKTHQGNNNGSTANTAIIANGVKDKEKQVSNKNIKEREKPRVEVNKVEKQEIIPNKNKVKVESNQTITKQNFSQPKNKPQQHIKQNVANDSSADDDEDDYRNNDRTNVKHKPSVDSDTDSIDAQEDLKFHKKPTPVNSSKNR